jgi:septal ring factor EnvC (AmiA/AmiB activator)
MEHVETPLATAARRLERAIERLEQVVSSRSERDREEAARLTAALRAAQMEQASLADANHVAADRVENTIGRLRGLLSF